MAALRSSTKVSDLVRYTFQLLNIQTSGADLAGSDMEIAVQHFNIMLHSWRGMGWSYEHRDLSPEDELPSFQDQNDRTVTFSPSTFFMAMANLLAINLAPVFGVELDDLKDVYQKAQTGESALRRVLVKAVPDENEDTEVEQVILYAFGWLARGRERWSSPSDMRRSITILNNMFREWPGYNWAYTHEYDLTLKAPEDGGLDTSRLPTFTYANPESIRDYGIENIPTRTIEGSLLIQHLAAMLAVRLQAQLAIPDTRRQRDLMMADKRAKQVFSAILLPTPPSQIDSALQFLPTTSYGRLRTRAIRGEPIPERTFESDEDQ